MLDWIFRILLFLSCGPLWRLGGWGTEGKYPNPVPWPGWRDTVIPILCGLWFGWYTKNVLVGFLTVITTLIIRLGYGPNSILIKTLSLTDVQARTLCGLMYGLIAFLPIAWYTKDWYNYILFSALLCLVNFFMVRFKIADIPTELFIGWTFGLAFLIYIKHP